MAINDVFFYKINSIYIYDRVLSTFYFELQSFYKYLLKLKINS